MGKLMKHARLYKKQSHLRWYGLPPREVVDHTCLALKACYVLLCLCFIHARGDKHAYRGREHKT